MKMVYSTESINANIKRSFLQNKKFSAGHVIKAFLNNQLIEQLNSFDV